jgi:hypothetical protein
LQASETDGRVNQTGLTVRRKPLTFYISSKAFLVTEDDGLDKTHLTAGVMIVVGVVVMAMADAMILATSPKYWNDVGYGTVDDFVKDGKQLDMFSAIFDAGLLVVFVGIAIMAFGLASAVPKPQQPRQVETIIPPARYQPPQYPQQQYPPQEYQPKP